MRFSTKKYTRPVISNNIKNLSGEAFLNATTLADALSPRAGRQSAQFAALNSYVNLNKVFSTSSKSNVKRAILSALKG